MKNPTPLFAPVIAATLPEGAAKAAAAAEDDMLGARRSDGAFLDSAILRFAERVTSRVWPACVSRRVGEVWPSKELQNSKLLGQTPATGRALFSSKSGKGYRHRTESLQHVAADPAHCGMVDL